MKITILLLTVFVLTGIISCQSTEVASTETATSTSVQANPFDASKSDPKAIEIAKKVETAAGGQAAWNETRYLHWNFFSVRDWYWDKSTGLIRMASATESLEVITSLHDSSFVIAKSAGKLITDPKMQQLYRNKATDFWINDSYWLFLPFKLMDPGVMLSYEGDTVTMNGAPIQQIGLTYDKVGITPNNKYLLEIDPSTNHIAAWHYYANKEDSLPKLSTPWLNYKPYGKLVLSDDRGRDKLRDIEVLTKVPDTLFTKL